MNLGLQFNYIEGFDIYGNDISRKHKIMVNYSASDEDLKKLITLVRGVSKWHVESVMLTESRWLYDD